MGLRLTIAIIVLAPAANIYAALPLCRVQPDLNASTLSCPSISHCNYCSAPDVCMPQTDPQLCGDEKGEDLFCCGCQCPKLNGETAVCSSTGADHEICLYPGQLDYCAAVSMLTLAQLRACYTTPLGDPTHRWNDGDCDQDGIANSIDGEPCVGITIPTDDGGPIEPDGGPDPAGDVDPVGADAAFSIGGFGGGDRGESEGAAGSEGAGASSGNAGGYNSSPEDRALGGCEAVPAPGLFAVLLLATLVVRRRRRVRAAG